MARNPHSHKKSQTDISKSIKNEPCDDASISSTTEIINKKIKKIPRKKYFNDKKTSPITAKALTAPALGEKVGFDEQCISNTDDIVFCKEHKSTVEFICKNITCLKQLCGHCILTHAEHISHIVSIKALIKDSLENRNNILPNPNSLLNDLGNHLDNNTKAIDASQKQIIECINKFMTFQRSKLVNAYEEVRLAMKNLANFSANAKVILNNETTTDTMTSGIKIENLEVIKTYIKYSDMTEKDQNLMPNFIINQSNVITEIEKALEANIYLSTNSINLETTIAPNSPKILHWFEWGKKRLNLYNIVTNTTEFIDLDISFKIPSFSRSLIAPDGKIYLIGGEEPEYFSRKEVYVYDHILNDKKLYQKASMLNKKFDFTVCYLNGYIYVMCGKDSSSEVVDTCEKYSVVDNFWIAISPVKKKRYAASATGFTNNNKIYLFGGRSDFNNNMVADIEEYNVETNEWTILNIKNNELWNPVEVCACIQITEDHILIFGGSDARIKDSNNSLVLNVRDYTLQKKGELKRAQVFVNPPFLYKGHIYALGNEYYMKHRNLHRYSIEKEEWEIIF